MQKQPSSEYELQYAPHPLPKEFPVSIGDGLYRQLDSPIIRLHLHNYLEVGCCFSGSGVFVIEDKLFPFRVGDVSVINDRELHLAQSTKGIVSEWIWIMMDPLQLLGSRIDDPAILSIAPLYGPDFQNILSSGTYPGITSLVRELITELQEKKSGFRSSVRGLVWALMIRLHRLPGKMVEHPVVIGKTYISRIAPALQLMAADYMEEIEIAGLARLCRMSLTHFRRIFNLATGRSPLQYLTHLRIQMASSLLLNTNHKILDISLDVGFATLSSFNRNFKSIMHMSPREWRKVGK